MSRISICHACRNLEMGIKTRIAVPHTCGKTAEEIEKLRFIPVRALEEIADNRGDIQPGQLGYTSSVHPHSSGKFPIWFHEKSYPVFLEKEQFEFCGMLRSKIRTLEVKIPISQDIYYPVRREGDAIVYQKTTGEPEEEILK